MMCLKDITGSLVTNDNWAANQKSLFNVTFLMTHADYFLIKNWLLVIFQIFYIFFSKHYVW